MFKSIENFSFFIYSVNKRKYKFFIPIKNIDLSRNKFQSNSSMYFLIKTYFYDCWKYTLLNSSSSVKKGFQLLLYCKLELGIFGKL
jgi:hypothetical protein